MRSIFSVLLGLLLLTGVSVDGTSAQTAPKVINGGVVNGKAINLPKPDYPAELKAAGVEGTIAVNVVIDEAGNVISAEAEINDQRMRKAEDGTVLEPAVADPQLRSSAEAAARGARFAPTMLSGVAVQIKGRIVYNFSAANRVVSSDGQPKVSGGGVLNGKAKTLALPEYPAAARAVGAGGAVSVQVLIDEDGNVVSATAVSGHPLLRAAAEKAAMQSTFGQTMLSGNPVKVSGVLTFNFVP